MPDQERGVFEKEAIAERLRRFERPDPYSAWLHSKGGRYIVLATAEHSETGESLVVYLDQRGNVWARPLAIFLSRYAPEG